MVPPFGNSGRHIKGLRMKDCRYFLIDVSGMVGVVALLAAKTSFRGDEAAKEADLKRRATGSGTTG